MDQIKWTMEQVDEQIEEILDEFDYHKVFHFCLSYAEIRRGEGKPTAWIDYDGIYQIKKELKEVLNDFKDFYFKNDCSYNSQIHVNGKWLIGISHAYDNENPLIEVIFSMNIAEQDASGRFYKKYYANK